MPTVKITKTSVDAMQPAAPRAMRQGFRGDPSSFNPDRVVNADAFLWDTDIKGFGLKVSAAGRKTFVFQYRFRGSRSDRRYKIGEYGAWTPNDARERAKELRRLVDAGIDPIEHDKALVEARAARKSAAVERALEDVADRWLKAYGVKKGKKRSKASIAAATLVSDKLTAEFGRTPIDEIDRAKLVAFFDRIPAAQVATRRNVFAYSRILWGWAEERDLLRENPFAKMRAPEVPASRERVLSDQELAFFWLATRKADYPFGPAFRLLALTGQRRSEVLGMQWSELSHAEKLWRIPGDRTKNGRPHTVPLSAAAIDELSAIVPKLKKWPTKGLIFTTTGQTAVSGVSRAKARVETEMAALAVKAKAGEPGEWRLHDLRRTVATGLQQLGIRWEVTEAVLNHVSGARGGVAGVYQQHDWAEEKRAALEAWGARLAGLAKPKSVAA